MTIREQEEELFRQWKQAWKEPSFIEDGVFDEDTWSSQPYKITFVLKEPNWPEETRTENICRSVMEGSNRNQWRTWNNIARWTKALLDGSPFPGALSRDQRLEQLRRVSFLNLKKAGGDGSADMDEIRSYAFQSAGSICRQLLLYRPDLLVCCGWDGPGVADILEKEVLERCGLPVQDREESEHISWAYVHFPGKERLTPVVDFRHPSQRGSGYPMWEEWYEWMLEIHALLIPHS